MDEINEWKKKLFNCLTLSLANWEDKNANHKPDLKMCYSVINVTHMDYLYAYLTRDDHIYKTGNIRKDSIILWY